MALLIAVAAGAAQAQTVEGDGGKYQLQGCYKVKEGVQCDLTFTADKDGAQRQFNPSQFQAVTPDGKSYVDPNTATAGGAWEFYYGPNVTLYKGVPIKVSLLFRDVSASQLSVLALEGTAIRNVPVRASAAAAPPSPAATTPAQVNLAGNWSATLTNCRQTSPGVVVCTATLKK
ncbi:hypothetical protein [Deinococcus sp. RM]|uniref:hypothetical protein n=1 Tax=Deinococcus sp. RM TaxID=2316359 RepID=UPI000E67F4B6|nr:hypothetical protein [Deinococcus sp. RM]RIY06769.1 hypothetical protein D3W47_08905 [Deinococcus sp. RM]